MEPLSIALYRPQIPPNLGNIARLCVALDLKLHVVGQTPIRWDESSLKRAGLDHWKHLRFEHHRRFKDFFREFSGRRIVAVTKSAPETIWDFKYEKGDVFFFGNEQKGLPPALLKMLPHHVRIPMWGEHVRSLNLANAVSIVSYEALRNLAGQREIDPAGRSYERTYYKKRENNES